MMHSVSTELEQIIDIYFPKLSLLENGSIVLKSAPGKWSKKEILGHLIDSAQSNLRRFIVAQYENNPKIVYQQDEWVRINGYQDADLTDLLQLWPLVNRQIVFVLNEMDEAVSERKCETGELHSLSWLAADYIKHLKHHLHQVLDLEAIAYP